jgi:hypothetical protein
MADRFSQTTLAVKEMMPIAPGAPAGRRETSDQISEI